MISTPARPKPRARRRATLLIVAVLGGVVLLAAAAWFAWASVAGGPPTSVPSCSWPLRVRGPATGEQAGLIRCYLRALATHDQGGMLAVTDTSDAPVRITGADFAHAADARSGTATATFTPNQDDTADFEVTVVFADRARQLLEMHAANPSSVHSWRLDIGTSIVSPGAPSPPPTAASPSP
jgi:hypothetical protein